MAAEEEPQKFRSPEPISITIQRARNLKGSKGDTLSSVVRAEYGSNPLGESPKVDVGDDGSTEYNFTAKLDCTFDDPAMLDEIAYKPVLITFVEVLPKEKKQKEEKTVTLGQCPLDLLPLVKGETKFKTTLFIHPLPGSPLEGMPADSPKAEADVVVCVNDPLLTDTDLRDGNLLTITAESAYSVPEAWNPSGTQYMYNITLPMPLTSEKESTIVLPNGQLKSVNDKEQPTNQKKWAVAGIAQTGSIYIPDRYISDASREEENGELTAKEERDFRMEAETEKNRVVWNCERRAFMDPGAVQSLQTKIATTRLWPVEVMRMPMPSANKGKGKDEENQFFFHGVAYVNLAPLLYPGVKKIRGAYFVHAFNEQEVYEKTKRKGGLAEEAAKVTTSMFRNSSPFIKGSKGGKDEKGGKDKDNTKKQPSQMLKPGAGGTDTASEGESQPPQNLEGMQYDEARTYIMLEFELEKPVVPKKPPEELASRVAEYIPPRPLFPRRTNGAQRAVDDYHQQISKIGSLVLDEFRSLFDDQIQTNQLSSNSEALEERKRRLIYELNTSGKYFAFKEQLKHSVVKIVREKYLKTSTFEDQEELQLFLSELYVFLVDQMHVGLGKVLSLEDETPVPAPVTTDEQLRHFAREAEVNENFELASKYYQERLARNRNDASAWFDYGTFSLLINDIQKAEECFKETVAISPKHLEGLMLYGVVCAMEERNDVAETFFEAATCVEPGSTLSWTLLGLFYDGIGKDIQAEYALMEAQKLNVIHASERQKQTKKEEMLEEETEEPMVEQVDIIEGGEDPQEERQDPVEDETGDQSSSIPVVQKIPATPTDGKPTPITPSKEKPAQVKQKMSISSKSDSPHSVAQFRVGQEGVRSVNSQHAVNSRPGSAQNEEPPPREPTPVPESSIYMIAVEFLLEVKATQFCERALAHELINPTGGPTQLYHVALARLHLQKKEYDDAEKSLTQALVLDYQDPDSWSIMGHLRYMQGNLKEARECYERTLSFIADAREMHSIYLRLASIYLHDAEYEKAKKTFLLACKNSPSCISWLGVGIACYRLGELSEAEDALCEANILNNSDPEVWGYLSLVCLRTGRQLEAEQAYKYALKVNLKDQDLLSEIEDTQKTVGFGNPSF
ncbi:Cilia- and flagella-associated protein 70 [Holothuria leucospilota]|uniref:Cilia- and flagella-associated protein 70 n=1 Tax=Holothuria leucospilota TaxID=206669 RepID=A0A9Q1HCV7_HOLLE|nr:Cilia- and flagella-associated protein 70 [Holothuria leucospilota]